MTDIMTDLLKQTLNRVTAERDQAREMTKTVIATAREAVALATQYRADRDLLVTEHAAALQHVTELQEQLRVATRVARDAEDALCVLRARLS